MKGKIEAILKRLEAAANDRDGDLPIAVVKSLNDVGFLLEALAEKDREIERLKGEMSDMLPRMDADAFTIGNINHEIKRLRKALCEAKVDIEIAIETIDQALAGMEEKRGESG